jgi:ubiquinone/menaquinone biosynthesis C-methylase UbiE
VATRPETDGAVRHPIFARVFDRLSRKVEDRGQAEHRRELLAGLAGRVIEVGAGNGLNFAHYPASVAEVVAVEPEPYLRERAEEAAATGRAAIRVVDGTAERLPAEAASFDAGVASLVLCSVPHQATALAELRRVIRPGGELRFYEHVRAGGPGMSRAQRIADRTFWPHFAGGCHASRDTAAAIAAAGFEIEACRGFRFAPSPLVALVAPHVLGVARRR